MTGYSSLATSCILLDCQVVEGRFQYSADLLPVRKQSRKNAQKRADVYKGWSLKHVGTASKLKVFNLFEYDELSKQLSFVLLKMLRDVIGHEGIEGMKVFPPTV